MTTNYDDECDWCTRTSTIKLVGWYGNRFWHRWTKRLVYYSCSVHEAVARAHVQHEVKVHDANYR